MLRTFSEAESERLDPGRPPLENVAAAIALRMAPERSLDGDRFVQFTPWTTIDDLRANLLFAQALGLQSLAPGFFLRRLRLAPGERLHERARDEGLLDESDPFGYRFRSDEVAAIHRWGKRLLDPAAWPEGAWERGAHRRLEQALASRDPHEWPLIAFAAIVEVIARGQPAAREVPDEAFAAMVRDAAREPIARLFPSEAVPLAPARFPPTEPPPPVPWIDPVWLYRLERDLLRAGMKRVAKREIDDAATLDEERAGYEALGYRTMVYETAAPANVWRQLRQHGDRPGLVLLVAREAADLDRFHALQAGEDPGGDPARTRELGRLLGYPECCVEAFIERALPDRDLYVLACSVAATRGVVSPALDPYHPAALIEYFPCAMDCAASIERAERIRAWREAHDPGARSPVPPPDSPSLIVSLRDRFELEGAALEEGGYRYRRAVLRGLDPWAREVEARLGRGDRLALLPRLLLVFRREDGVDRLLEAIPHDLLVPIPYGLPVHLDWLARVPELVARFEPPQGESSVTTDGAVRALAGRGDDAGATALLFPEVAPDELRARFDAALDDARPALARYCGRRLAGHMILFDDGDYLCFRGAVDLAGGGPRALTIDAMLAYRLREDSPRRRLYGRLSPGASIRVTPEALHGDEGAWDEPLASGVDYHVLSFGPARLARDPRV